MTVNATSLYPNPNITSFVKFFEYGNTVTSNGFTTGIIGMFWMVMFISLKRFDTPSAFTASSFLTSLIAILFRVSGLLSETIALIPIIMTGIGFLILYVKND